MANRARDEEERLAGTERPVQVIDWAPGGLELRIEVGHDGMARLTRLAAPGGTGSWPDLASGGPAGAALPLLDVVLAGEGRAWSGGRYCESEAAYRFRYAGHDVGQSDVGPWRELRVDLDDPVTGLRAEVSYRALAANGAGGALRSWVRLQNRGTRAGHGPVGDLAALRRPRRRPGTR